MEQKSQIGGQSMQTNQSSVATGVELGPDQPKLCSIFYALCLMTNKISKMRAPPQPLLCSAPRHTIIFMWFIGLVSMATTFYHNQLKEVSEENIFSFPPILPGTFPFKQEGALLLSRGALFGAISLVNPFWVDVHPTWYLNYWMVPCWGWRLLAELIMQVSCLRRRCIRVRTPTHIFHLHTPA